MFVKVILVFVKVFTGYFNVLQPYITVGPKPRFATRIRALVVRFRVRVRVSAKG